MSSYGARTRRSSSLQNALRLRIGIGLRIRARRGLLGRSQSDRRAVRYPEKILKQMLRAAINATPAEKLVITNFFPCFIISPRMACAAK